MAFRLPPMHALEAFEAVARHHSFLKAADALCVTQSAVSHRIKQLEDHLGVKLFLRINRNIVLTPVGEGYLVDVRRILADIEVATRAVVRGQRLSLRVSVAPAIGSRWLVGRLADFQRQHPDVDLIVSASLQLANIRSGEVDVGIRYGCGEWPGLLSHKLFDEVLVAVCSAAYAQGVGGLAQPADLSRARLLRHPSLPWQPWLVAAGLDWQEPGGGVQFDDATMMIEAAVAGNGVAITPRKLVEPYLAAGRLQQLFGVAALDRGYYVVLAPAAAGKPWIMDFANWLMAAAVASKAEALVP